LQYFLFSHHKYSTVTVYGKVSILIEAEIDKRINNTSNNIFSKGAPDAFSNGIALRNKKSGMNL